MRKTRTKPVRIGCSAAFWGDTEDAAIQLVRRSGAPLDYLCADYLAEVTMVILARKRRGSARDRGGAGEGGYVREFVSALYEPLCHELAAKRTRVVSNAGGLNPLGLKKAIEEAAHKANVRPMPRVAAVYGDDLRDTVSDIDASEFSSFSAIADAASEAEAVPSAEARAAFLSCNVYFGARGIVQALDAGADIVVTGRCVDSAMVLGPLIHEFGWDFDSDYDRLAAGALAGHVLECGAQATGGNFTDWRHSANTPHGGWSNMGFPIATVHANGAFVVSKPPRTGGVIEPLAVAEQILYEIGDPSSYILPDVICDWRNVSVTAVNVPSECNDADNDDNDDASGVAGVLVRGARGRAPTAFYKVCATQMNGFMVSATLLVPGDEAYEKALAVGRGVLARAHRLCGERNLPPLGETRIEVLGAGELWASAGGSTRRGSRALRELLPQNALEESALKSVEDAIDKQQRVAVRRRRDACEVVLRIAARSASPAALGVLCRELAPAATGMAPGLTGGGSGRPRPTPAIRLRSFLVRRQALPPASVLVGDNAEARSVPHTRVAASSANDATTSTTTATTTSSSIIHSKSMQTISSTHSAQLPLSSSSSSSLSTSVVCNVPRALSNGRVLPLRAVAVARSGDKGDAANIGCAARATHIYPLLCAQLSEARVAAHFSHVLRGTVRRYELRGLRALNFVLTRALGGGGVNSLHIDRQGKTYAQVLLTMPIFVPFEWIANL